MRRSIAKRCFEAFLTAILVMLTSVAHADPIPPTYTVTDLGSTPVAPFSAYVPTYSTDAGGNRTVIGPNGQSYAFPQAVAGTPLPSSEWAGLPVPQPIPPTYGMSSPNWSTAIDATLYPNGIVTAVDAVSQNSRTWWLSAVPYYIQRNPDGSWGPPVVIGPGSTEEGPPNWGVTILGMDKAGNILIQTMNPQFTSGFDYSVYNTNTKISTDLSTLSALISGKGFSYFEVFGMDNQGRILLQAEQQMAWGSYATDLLLLSPAGVSSDPINTPEPGSLAVMALAFAAFAIQRARRRG